MRLIVNGEPHEVAAATLAALLVELGYEGGWYATAVNRQFVPRDRRPETPLGEGDYVEILMPRQGG